MYEVKIVYMCKNKTEIMPHKITFHLLNISVPNQGLSMAVICFTLADTKPAMHTKWWPKNNSLMLSALTASFKREIDRIA